MANPTTSILDTFDRTDAASLGSNWTEGDLIAGDDNFEIISNVCQNDDGGNNAEASARWNVETFGPNSEVFCDVTVLPINSGDRNSIACKAHNIGSGTTDAYGLSLRGLGSGSHEYRAQRIDNESDTDLGAAVSATFNADDQLFLEVKGDQVVGYRDGTAVITRTDSTYESNVGEIGLYNWENVEGDTRMALNDFGGGTVAVAGAAVGHGQLLSGSRNRLVLA